MVELRHQEDRNYENGNVINHNIINIWTAYDDGKSLK
jgi:hypothetical protein